MSEKIAMVDEFDVSKIVTAFFLNTCRLPPCPSKQYVDAVAWCAKMTEEQPEYDEEAEIVPLVSGSVAEFYIKPMLPHVGDINVMFHVKTKLAIPRGHPPPTRLPAEFHNYVKVHEVIDSHLPGYVYLPLRYLVTKCRDDGKYNINIEYDKKLGFTQRRYNADLHKHWPAVFTDISHTSHLSVDEVRCVRCLSWPPQAADWPTRHRNYGWPDSATLDRVVSNGCDVVAVAHRQCRQDCHSHDQKLYC